MSKNLSCLAGSTFEAGIVIGLLLLLILMQSANYLMLEIAGTVT